VYVRGRTRRRIFQARPYTRDMRLQIVARTFR